MDWMQMISTLGFPIACVVALGWFIATRYDKIATENKEREDRYISLLTESQRQMKELSATNASFVTIISQMQDDVDQIKTKLNIQSGEEV